MSDDDDISLEHTRRLAAAVARVMQQTRDEFGIAPEAFTSALLATAIGAARQHMDYEATAAWLRSVADAVDREAAALWAGRRPSKRKPWPRDHASGGRIEGTVGQSYRWGFTRGTLGGPTHRQSQ